MISIVQIATACFSHMAGNLNLSEYVGRDLIFSN